MSMRRFCMHGLTSMRLLTASMLLVVGIGTAQAVPSFARQTGAECGACHVGAFGPRLTAYGIKFKLSGYTERAAGAGSALPVSGRVLVVRDDPAVGDTDTRVSEASVYLAGRLADNIGTYTEVRRTEDAQGNHNTALRTLDLRYVQETEIAGKDVLLGVTLSNSPGVTAPIDTGQLWNIPAIATDGTLFNPTVAGRLSHRMLGVTAYGLIDNSWYFELGGYRSMSRGVQDSLGLDAKANDPGATRGISPYWRLGYFRDLRTHAYSFGFYGMQAEKQLTVLSAPGAPRVTERSGAYDDNHDIGFDAMYQYRGDRSNVFQLRANYVSEIRDYGSTPTVFGIRAKSTGRVNETTLVASYSLNETWSVAAARVWVRTNKDFARYFNGEFTGTADSDINYYEVAWVPFGKEGSNPWTNLRLMASWIQFNKFNGAEKNIFFNGLDASDLDTFTLSANIAF